MKDGFVKTAAGTPDIKVADCGYNCARIKALIDKAHEQGVRVLVLPELCITGYTCQDLFFQQTLLDGALNALKDITEHSAGLDMLIAVGCPLRFRGELYNCAVVMKDGKILGVVPKKFLPNYNEFYEKRHFTAAPEGEYDIELFGESVPFGLGLLFECRGTPELVFAAEICEDLWAAEASEHFTRARRRDPHRESLRQQRDHRQGFLPPRACQQPVRASAVRVRVCKRRLRRKHAGSCIRRARYNC